MKRTTALLFLLAISPAGYGGGIQKWTDKDGNVHFGDIPPPRQQTKHIEVRDPATGNGSMVRPGSISLGQRRRSDTGSGDKTRDYGERLRYRNAAVKGEVLMGMTPKELERALGRPTRINRSQGSWGEREQWVYDRPGGTDYIYLENGKVTSRN